MIRHTSLQFIAASSGSALIALSILVAPSSAITMYIVHGGGEIGAPHGGEVARLNLDNGAITTLGIPVPSAGLTGISFVGSHLYASTSNHSLIEISPATGGLISETLFSGAGFNSAAGDRIIDLATSPGGTLYAVRGISGQPASWALQTVNPVTGVLTNIGVLPDHGGGFSSIAFATNGKLYAHQTNAPGSFDEINPATGASVQNLLGGVPGGALGLGFNPDNGLLIASECCNSTDGSLGERVYSLNPANGAAVQLYDFNDGRRIHDFTVVPEPGTGLLIFLGLSAIAIRRRRRIG